MSIKYILFSSAFLLVAYIIFRIIIKRDYKRRLKLSPLSYSLEILVFAIHANLFYLAVPTKWPYITQLPENPSIRIISTIIFSIGLIVLLISWFNLGTKPSLGMDKNKLKTGGLYKYSRNPQLVGYGLMLASLTIMYFSYLVLIWFLLYIIASYFMLKSEEEFLTQKYNKVYRDYCRQVPRIFKF
jgi:protein-S-isoprenylcysteine O-methyltransferase Ste14